MEIPIGYRFQPTDEELITFYLSQKLLGNPLPPLSCIVEKQVNGDSADPWHVFSDQDPWITEKTTDNKKEGMKTLKKTVYVFSKLTKIGPKRISRTAGCGSWAGQSGEKAVKNSRGDKIGSKKMLNFETKRSDVDTHGHWIMYQYCAYDRNGEKIDDYVVSKITRTWNINLAKDHDLEQQQRIKKRSLVVLEDQEEDGINSNKKAKKMMTMPAIEETTLDSTCDQESSSAANADQLLSWDEFDFDVQGLLVDETAPTLQDYFAGHVFTPPASILY